MNSLLDYDVSGESIYSNPPWSLAVACVQHLRSCHAKAPMDTTSVIALPNWHVYKAITKELKLLRQSPKGENVFMRPPTTRIYDPSDFIKSIWVINNWVIDVDTPIMAKIPTIVVKGDLTTPPIIDDLPTNTHTNGMEPEAAIYAADTYLLAAAALVVMNPLENHSLVRFTVWMSQENITYKADTLIDTAASLNFVSKKFLDGDGFYKYCKASPKIFVRVANEQRIVTDNVFCPTVFTIDGQEFAGLQFIVLPHFKSSDIILGLPALRDLNVKIHLSSNEFTVKKTLRWLAIANQDA
jgi:hypothetical protein